MAGGRGRGDHGVTLTEETPAVNLFPRRIRTGDAAASRPSAAPAPAATSRPAPGPDAAESRCGWYASSAELQRGLLVAERVLTAAEFAAAFTGGRCRA